MPNLKALHEIGGNGTHNILMAMADAATREEIVPKLEEITVLSSETQFLSEVIPEYFRVVRPPLRILKVPVTWIDCIQESEFIQSLRLVQGTITQLQLKVDCADVWSKYLKTPIQGDAGFYLNGRRFPNLTYFKVVMDFEAGTEGRILSFDLNHLRKMPKLKELFFGFKKPEAISDGVAKKKIISEEAPIWINVESRFTPKNDTLPKGIHFDPILKDEGDEDGLKDLKFFHFHQNLEKSSLQLLGKWTKNLKTLETVLDEENFSAVEESWGHLQNLKLLKGSKVPRNKLLFGSKINILEASD